MHVCFVELLNLIFFFLEFMEEFLLFFNQTNAEPRILIYVFYNASSIMHSVGEDGFGV